MLFNTWYYFIFLGTILVLYYRMSRQQQNILLLAASYYFYGSWDYRYLVLILICTTINYVCGIYIDNSKNKWMKYAILVVSCASCLSILAYFKYANFFIDSMNDLLLNIGIPITYLRLEYLLPVGISFYTFQTMSYTIDVYRGNIRACKNIIEFSVFVAFFPQLVAGPIERAGKLLIQFQNQRQMTYANMREGLWLILWGLYKKVVIADNLAFLVDTNFGRSEDLNFTTAYLTVLAFSYQIYCDFSGYTDIAKGSAKLMGFSLSDNFKRPYSALNPQEFWRRWHITLSTWFRDYVYIPLGGNTCGDKIIARNIMITMLLAGLWHGASWNYIWWGIYHGSVLIVYIFYTKIPNRIQIPSIVSYFLMSQIVLLGWLIFRCTKHDIIDGKWVDRSVEQIINMMTSYQRGFEIGFDANQLIMSLCIFVVPLKILEIIIPQEDENIGPFNNRYQVQILIISFIIFMIIRYGVQFSNAFIYFQF